MVTLPPYPPQPFIVLKTKRLTNQEKVFINLLNLPKIYFTNQSVNYFVSCVNKTEDKGGETCDVYDVYMTEEETIHLTNSNDMSRACVLIIETINVENEDSLDTDYKTPKIKGNYKSSGSEVPLYKTNKQIPIETLRENPTLNKLYEDNLKNLNNLGESQPSLPSKTQNIPRVIHNSPPSIVQGWMKKKDISSKQLKNVILSWKMVNYRIMRRH